jgi:methylthioribose-1-phosphate isomerase
MRFKTMEWKKSRLFLLDQTKLPARETYVACSSYGEVAQAIRRMVVRGAPAIGVAAAFGMALGARQYRGQSREGFRRHLERVAAALVATRPTAVNLAWGVERMKRAAEAQWTKDARQLCRILEREAVRILEEDIRTNRELGRQGEILIPDGSSILTHCNAGALATAGYGTALGVIRAAWEAGKRIHVFVDETRPFLQGSRLTAWELMKDRIPCTLIADNMAGALMLQGKIQLAIVGADRIAANGDVANKIGTYSLARLCQAHNLPFYVAAPTSTIDLLTRTGRDIPIEQRSIQEITQIRGRSIAPAGVKVLNPAFDVTPNRFIRAIITEKGIIQRPYKNNLKKFLSLNGKNQADETPVKCPKNSI